MGHKGFLHKILFLDIETVPLNRKFEDLSVHDQILFEKKTRFQRRDNLLPSEYYKNAGIWAEFGKIICISAGIIFQENNDHIGDHLNYGFFESSSPI